MNKQLIALAFIASSAGVAQADDVKTIWSDRMAIAPQTMPVYQPAQTVERKWTPEVAREAAELLTGSINASHESTWSGRI